MKWSAFAGIIGIVYSLVEWKLGKTKHGSVLGLIIGLTMLVVLIWRSRNERH